jgi:hypothetical protein
MNQVYGQAYAKSLASDLVMSKLGGRTAQQALDAGEAPKDVWNALADQMELTEEQRWIYRAELKKKKRRR